MDLAGVTDRHDELNPAIWHGQSLDRAVRQRLLGIADAFVAWAASPMRRTDVVLTGSAANFNYSAGRSDIDLHLVYNFKVLSPPPVIQTLKDALSAKQAVWNLEHRISIRGLPVEVYVQATDEPHYSSGVYSVEKDAWLARPKTPPTVDAAEVDRKVANFRAQINHALASQDRRQMEAIKKKIKTARQRGLEAGGEFSADNLAFKVLRRTGDIGRLAAATRQSLDDELSLGPSNQDDAGDFGTELLSGIKSAVQELTA